MALIQNEDNKCPTTKQVNDALKSMGGEGQLSLTETSTLIYQLIQLMSLNYCSLDISVHTG